MKFRSAREAAEYYSGLGWYSIPLKPRTKECRDKNWLNEIYTPDQFGDNDNIGLRFIGEKDPRSKKLVGVDVDAEEAVAIVWDFLPPTDAHWGRESKILSHALYLSEFDKAVAHKDLVRKATLIEIRVDHQSMAPPSVHPSGEELEWRGEKIEAPKVEAKVLKRAVQLLATATLAGRYYQPQGHRHEWHLALAGALRATGLTEDEVHKVSAAAGRIGGEGKPADRASEVRTTFARNEEDHVTGMTTLADRMGEVGKAFVDSLRKIWSERGPFRLDDRGKRVAQNDQDNIRKAFEKMALKLHKNEFSHGYVVRNGTGPAVPVNDEVIDDLWLKVDAQFKFRPSADFFKTVVFALARENPVHPVRDYLLSLKWDETPRIDKWLTTYGGARDEEFVSAVGRIGLIAAVRRIMKPGCKFDELIVLESSQGQNKSTALRALCPHDDWFSDDLPLGVDSKLVIERTSGKWIVEAAELMNMRKAQVEHLKSFLSRQVDGPVRMAYARTSEEVKRQFMIFGTTNSTSYLSDPTGNRRFWPIPVKVFNIKRLMEDRDQLWAEAVAREAAGESIRLDSKLWGVAAKKQEARRTEDPWEPTIGKFIEGLPKDAEKQRVLPDEIWDALGISVAQRDIRGAERMSSIMQKHGFRRMSIKKGQTTMYGWGRDLIDGIWRPAGWVGQ